MSAVAPQHGSRSTCKTCGHPIEFISHEAWNGAEYEALDQWWAHATFHPADGHDAQPVPFVIPPVRDVLPDLGDWR